MLELWLTEIGGRRTKMKDEEWEINEQKAALH
jgi:hypothetical protein